jgi:cytochrome c peroxidase
MHWPVAIPAERAATAIVMVIVLAMAGGSLRSQSPLGPPTAPIQNPVTPAKAVLGKMLFWEEQLSSNGRIACGRCHLPEFGGADARRSRHPGHDGQWMTLDDTFGSPGIERRSQSGSFLDEPQFGYDEQVTSRAAPSAHLASYFDELFWDGRAEGPFVDPETGVTVIAQGGALEVLCLHPLRNEVEMSREQRTWTEIKQRLVVARPLALAINLPTDIQQALTAAPNYPQLFAAAFGDTTITAPRIAMSLATYLRTLVPNQTPWDMHVQGTTTAMTASQQAGWQVFQNQGRCALCHTPGLFSDHQYRGVGLVSVQEDPGRGGITGVQQEMGMFKVPSLRNAGLKSTLMHNGRFTSMTQVINFYRLGAGLVGPRDPLLQALPLSQQQLVQLTDFVENALVDPRASNALPPFDRPTLRSETVVQGANQFGTATPTGGYTPRLLADIPCYIGNSEWAIGIVDAPPMSAGWLVIGLLPASPGTTLAGVTLHTNVAALALLIPAATSSSGDATISISVPNTPALVGIPFAAQALLGTASSPQSWCGTSGASFVIL